MNRDLLRRIQAMTFRFCLCATAFAFAVMTRADFQGSTHLMPFEEDPINYNATKPGGPVAEMLKRIECGSATLRYDKDYGWLLSLLGELKVPKSSQMLVFSRTSLQRERISPQTPRSIFFGDNVYLG